MEQWERVKGYEGLYEVSTCGRIRSLDRYDCMGREHKGRIIQPAKQKNGYLYVTLYKGGKQSHILVHRAVADTFIENPALMPEVNHVNENKADNTVENLFWCTHKQNHNYGTGHIRAAIKQGKSIVQKTNTGEILKIWPSIREAARKSGAGRKEISRCCNGELRTANGFIWEYA